MNNKLYIVALAAALGFMLHTSITWAKQQAPVNSAQSPTHAEDHAGHATNDNTEHYLRHLVDHAKEIGLSPDQLISVKALQLDFDLTRIKGEAEIMLTEREIAAMFKDDKTDVPAVEVKIRESEAMRAGLRVASLKSLRKGMALLTPEQREKSRRILAAESRKTDMHS